MLLPLSLEAVNTTVSTGADAKANTMGAPQRGHRALLEPLTQFGDALSSVDASLAILAEAADGVLVETVTGRRSWEGEECQGALTRKQNSSEAAAHLRLVIFVSLRTAASAEAPSALMLLPPRLQ